MHMVLASDGARVGTQVSLSSEPLLLASLRSCSGNEFRELSQDYSASRRPELLPWAACPEQVMEPLSWLPEWIALPSTALCSVLCALLQPRS